MKTPSSNEINEMNKQISLLRTRAEVSSKDATEAFKTQVRAAEDHMNLVKARMEKMGTQASEASEEMRKGVEEAWKKLTDSVSKATEMLH